jgi:hypothetical protein
MLYLGFLRVISDYCFLCSSWSPIKVLYFSIIGLMNYYSSVKIISSSYESSWLKIISYSNSSLVYYFLLSRLSSEFCSYFWRKPSMWFIVVVIVYGVWMSFSSTIGSFSDMPCLRNDYFTTFAFFMCLVLLFLDEVYLSLIFIEWLNEWRFINI